MAYWDTYINPAETGLYYLNSRYYDSVTGRFINADNFELLFNNQDYILQYNLYTYCINNAVNYIDKKGETAVYIWIERMGWLAFVDGPFPIGDVVYIGGVVILTGTSAVSILSQIKQARNEKINKKNDQKNKKTSKKSGKEKADDVPDWAKRQSYNP